MLNLASALLFGDDFQSPFITGSHQPPVLWECPDELLFPVIRFHYMLLRTFIVSGPFEKLEHILQNAVPFVNAFLEFFRKKFG
mgnify:CR=1 FL=1